MPPTFIRVSISIPQVSGVFDYHVPESLQTQVRTGCLIEVPFGKQTVQGIVIEQITEPSVPETRPISALLDIEPVITAQQLALAKELAKDTLSTLSACLALMLPPGLSQQTDTLYTLVSQPPSGDKPLTPLQEKLIAVLNRRGALRGRQLATSLPKLDWKPAAFGLVRRGLLLAQPVLPPPTVRAKIARTVQLSCVPEIATPYMEKLGTSAVGKRRFAILEFLIKEALPVSTSWVFAASGGQLSDLQHLADAGLISFGETEIWRDPLENLIYSPQIPPELTADQVKVFEEVRESIIKSSSGETQTPILLHGVTGSGKTEIYIRAAAETLHLGRQVIILVPEIALTPQTVQRFMARFPGQVGLVHSKLSPGERYDTWRRARAGMLPVIIGPRSALFTPLPNLGLIVVDECHEDSYFQNEAPPYYNAVQAAIIYARVSGCVLLLGSATPEINLIFRARKEHWKQLKLPDRLLAHFQAVEAHLSQSGLSIPNLVTTGTAATLPLPPIQVVDMRQELKAGNRSIFSRALVESLTHILEAKQQAILYINRRGSATYVFCRDCGYTLTCPRCDLPLTSHSVKNADNRLFCHHCNYQRMIPARCPKCQSVHIRQYGSGTEKVEAEVQHLFPNARTLRWDAETTRSKGAHDIILSHFINYRADILIGTQMLAKGLDLPLITLVGVVLADVGLNFPDFRAAERTFQLLTQVAGRAGRSPLGGKVILQTFNPDHYAIKAAAQYDFENFYKTELEYRRRIDYPPFSRLIRLEYRHLQSNKAEEAARDLAKQIEHWISIGEHKSTEIIGPVPCYFSRLNGYYRWQLILRGPNPAPILLDRSLGDWRVEVDPPNLL